jgi:hypothetical protein
VSSPRRVAEITTIDDDTLVAMASTGLLRRARKLDVSAVEVCGDAFTVTGEGWTVRVGADRPLVAAECQCPTSGSCQHVLAALLHLRQRYGGDGTEGRSGAGPEADEAASPDGSANGPHEATAVASGAEGAERAVEDDVGCVEDGAERIRQWLLEMSLPQLRRALGAPGLEWAGQRLGLVDQAQVSAAGALTVVLGGPFATVRFTDTDMSGVVVTPAADDPRRATALAVLVVRRQGGAPLPAAADRPDRLAAERLGVATSIVDTCCNTVELGLSRVGEPTRARFSSLAGAARGATLYRLARLADRTAATVTSLRESTVDADPEQLLELLCELAVLAETVQDRLKRCAPVGLDLAGTATTRYEPVGSLSLIGLGWHAWSTGQFSGSTAALLARDSGRILTARVLSRGPFAASLGGAGWREAPPLPALTAVTFRLVGARIGTDGSVSVAPSTAFHPLPAVDLLPTLQEAAWTGACPAARSRLTGTRGGHWVVLGVDERGPSGFDPVRQVFCADLVSRGRGITLRLGYGPDTAQAITALESLAGPWRFVVADLSSGTSGLEAFPVSLVTGEGRLVPLWPSRGAAAHPSLAAAGPSAAAGPRAAAAGPAEPTPAPTPVERFTHRLVVLAERGSPTPADLTALAGLADAWGLSPVAAVLGRTDTRPTPPSPPMRVLRAAWVLGEYRMGEVELPGDDDLPADTIDGIPSGGG